MDKQKPKNTLLSRLSFKLSHLIIYCRLLQIYSRKFLELEKNIETLKTPTQRLSRVLVMKRKAILHLITFQVKRFAELLFTYVLSSFP